MVFKNVLEAVGNTPLIRLSRMTGEDDAEVLVKYEGLNVGGSIKTRTALQMILAKAIFEDGTAEAKFKVDEVKAPETGDNNSIALWISLMGIALLLAAAAFFVLRRKHANK